MELTQLVWALLVIAYAGYAVRVLGARRGGDGMEDLSRPPLPRLLQGAAPLERVGQVEDLRRAEDRAVLRRAA